MGNFLAFTERIDDVQLLDIEKITLLRQQRGWSRRHLAEEAKIDPSVITRIENGQQQDFKISVVSSIANAFGIPVDALLLESRLYSQSDFVPELQTVMAQLTKHPAIIQRHAAGMIQGYLNTLE